MDNKRIVEIIKFARNAKYPSWKREYTRKIANSLQVHTKGFLFSKVDKLFPNEHPASKKHCIDTYEPITKGSIWKGINDIIRIFSNSSFSVTAGDITLQRLQDVSINGSPFFSYFLEKWVHIAVASDPNAVCVVYPPLYEKEKEINPIHFVASKHILHFDDEMLVFMSENESKKKLSFSTGYIVEDVFYDDSIGKMNSSSSVEKSFNQKVEEKITEPVYHVFTKEAFIRFTVDEKSQEVAYDVYHYPHLLDFMPAFLVGGVELTHGVYESFCSSFIPFGNLALLQHRNHRAVDLIFSYPRMSEIQSVCDEPGCQDGKVPCEESDEYPDGHKACNRCKGLGFVTVQSPYKVYQKRLEQGLLDPETIKAHVLAPSVEYYTPDTSILDYSKNSWRDYLQMAEEAIFIQQKQKTGNVESGKAKEIDREEKYAWLQNISRVFYDKLRYLVMIYEGYINRQISDVSVEAPVSFAILTEGEAFEALNIIVSSEAPVFVKSQQVENFVKKFVSKTSPIVKALRVLKKVDPLLFYSNKDIQQFKSNAAITAKTWTTHIYAYPLLMQMYENDKQAFEEDDKKIIENLLTRIDELRPVEGSVELKQSLIESLS